MRRVWIFFDPSDDSHCWGCLLMEISMKAAGFGRLFLLQ
jgi:hypothetical protein